MTTPRAKPTKSRIVSSQDMLHAGLLTYRSSLMDEASLVLFLGAEVMPQLGITGVSLLKINSKAHFRIGSTFGCLWETLESVEGTSLYENHLLAKALTDGVAEGPLEDFIGRSIDDDRSRKNPYCLVIRVGGMRPILVVLASRTGPFVFGEHATELFSFVMECYLADAAPKNGANASAQDGDGLEGVTLTPRQISILDAVTRNRTNKEIGIELSISEALVKHEIRLILQALGVSNRVDAALAASRLGLID